jgi:hypothetical protein
VKSTTSTNATFVHGGVEVQEGLGEFCIIGDLLRLRVLGACEDEGFDERNPKSCGANRRTEDFFFDLAM